MAVDSMADVYSKTAKSGLETGPVIPITQAAKAAQSQVQSWALWDNITLFLRDGKLLLQQLNNQRGVPKIGSLSLIPETHNFDLQHVPWYLSTYTHHTKSLACVRR